MIAREDLMRWELGSHGSTYGGSPVSCAAALATFDVIEDEGLLENARTVGEVLPRAAAARSRNATRSMREVRGRALWIGLSFADHRQALAVEQAAFRKGLLVLGCGDDAIRISPPLNVPRGPGARRPRDLRGGRRRGRSRRIGSAP